MGTMYYREYNIYKSKMCNNNSTKVERGETEVQYCNTIHAVI